MAMGGGRVSPSHDPAMPTHWLTADDPDAIRVRAEDLEAWGADAAAAAGLPRKDAQLLSRQLTLANLRGVDSHGFNFFPAYVQRLRSGATNLAPRIAAVRETPSTILYDADRAQGVVSGVMAVDAAIEKALAAGVGVAALRNANHLGMMAFYALRAVEADVICQAITNAPPGVAPWGSRMRFMGTNPYCCGIPAGEELPIVLDMATSVVARGKILLARRKGYRIPLGWCLDPDGRPTEEPEAGLAGAMLPFAAHKGSGLAIVIDLLSGALGGAAVAPDVGGLISGGPNKSQNVGALFVCMRTDLWRPLAEFKATVDRYVRTVRALPKAPRVERIYLPGEVEEENRRRRGREGIPFPRQLVDELAGVGQELGVPFIVRG